MGYWQEVKGVVTKGVNLALEGVKEGAYIAKEETKKGTNTAKVKAGLFFKQRELHNILADFGDMVYDVYKEKKDIYEDKEIGKIAAKIEKMEIECKKMQNDTKSGSAKASSKKKQGVMND